MSSLPTTTGIEARPALRAADAASALPLLLGLGVLYGPTFHDFLVGGWSGYSQGHEPLVLAVAAWLLWLARSAVLALPDAARWRGGATLVAAGLLMYWFGRSQQLLRLELLSILPVLAGCLVAWKGWPALRPTWFALAFLLFVIPLPYAVVVSVTGPMKQAVSAIAAQWLYWLDYPVGRSGVMITVGQYQLLVAEACAGLHTLFTLEAVGLLYARLMGYRSWVRNALLAVLVVPTAFAANVVRVVILMLVTYHFGDAAGQGFVHGFAGIVLFAVALLFIFALDRALGWLLPVRWAR
jgi:exosortase B